MIKVYLIAWPEYKIILEIIKWHRCMSELNKLNITSLLFHWLTSFDNRLWHIWKTDFTNDVQERTHIKVVRNTYQHAYSIVNFGKLKEICFSYSSPSIKFSFIRHSTISNFHFVSSYFFLSKIRKYLAPHCVAIYWT